MTVYTMVGGIKAVVWIGVLQSVVLIAGTLIVPASPILIRTPGGLGEIVRAGAAARQIQPRQLRPVARTSRRSGSCSSSAW